MSSVAIIGAGIVGCSAAHYLAQAGTEVTVMDAERIGGQASLQTAGNLHLQLSYRAMRDGEAAFRRHCGIAELNHDADTRWTAFTREFDGRIEVIRNGGVVVAESADDLAGLRAKVELECATGIDTELLDSEQTRDKVPELGDTVLGASWHPAEGHVNVETTCQVLTATARQRGARFLSDSLVTTIKRAAGGWRLYIDGGSTHHADAVIVAAGAWTEKVLTGIGAYVPMRVSGLSMISLDLTRPLMSHLVMHASRPLSIKQTAMGSVVVGGGRPAAVRTTASIPLGMVAESMPESERASVADTHRIIPATAGLPVARTWQGLLGAPADELPVIGAVPGHPGVFVSVAGHTGYTLGPTCGWAVAQQVLGRTTDLDLSRYGPARFG